ncbi:MAG UNVERIFIED_CONTAM: hypothetical protein LVR29_16965 [Microcystis novacekii LVE1205-3]
MVSQKIFERLTHILGHKLIKWGIKRHRNKGRKWISKRHFHTIGGNNWAFTTREENNPLRLY